MRIGVVEAGGGVLHREGQGSASNVCVKGGFVGRALLFAICFHRRRNGYPCEAVFLPINPEIWY